ncbi:hypothetical protein ACLOJK_028986 [Asimina triloba]
MFQGAENSKIWQLRAHLYNGVGRMRRETGEARLPPSLSPSLLLHLPPSLPLSLPPSSSPSLSRLPAPPSRPRPPPLTLGESVSPGLSRSEREDSTIIVPSLPNDFDGNHSSAITVLFLQGFGVGSFHYEKQLKDLGCEFRAWALDFLGQGMSLPSEDPAPSAKKEGISEEKDQLWGFGEETAPWASELVYSMDLWQDQVREFIEQVIGEPIYVAGNSLGGYVALYFAACNPHLVKGVALLNATPFWGFLPNPKSSPKLAKLFPWAGTFPLPSSVRRITEIIWQKISDPVSIREVLKQVYADHSTKVDKVFSRILETTQHPAATASFASIMCKVNNVLICLMYGKEDPWVRPVWGLKVKQEVPEAPYYEISPAGHCPHDEVPEGKLIVEQEVLFGSKPSPSKTPHMKKLSRTSTGSASRRLSLGGTSLAKPEFHSTKHVNGSTASTVAPCPIKKGDRLMNHYHHEDDFAALSAGRRGLDVAGLPVKKQSFDTFGESEAPSLLRKPFSPLTTEFSIRNTTKFPDPSGASIKIISANTVQVTAPSKANTTNFLEDLNNSYNRTSLKVVTVDNALTTPSGRASAADEENRTPKTMPIMTPSTPSTISVPMQTSHMPGPVSVLFGTAAEEESEEIEYSFEEKRVGFIVPKSYPKTVHV